MNRYLEDYKKAIETLVTLENEGTINSDWGIDNECKVAWINKKLKYFEFGIEELADIDKIRKEIKKGEYE